VAKNSRVQKKTKSKHRAVKVRVARPLDVARADNHAARHEAKKMAALEAATAPEIG
jgi:hypothetical protein